MTQNRDGEESVGQKGLFVGVRYEFTHGPASASQRISEGVLEEFDHRSATYTFRLDDGSQVELVDHEVDAARPVEDS